MIKILEEPRKKVAFISSYTPRRCGIATFTSDLIENVDSAGHGWFKSMVVAMDTGQGLEYDETVKLRIRKDVKDDYINAAECLNASNVDVVSIQHEFGLFGGEGGWYLRLLLERLNKPVVTTLHTVLEKSGAKEYCDSLVDVCGASNKIVVMNERGVGMLRNIYGISEKKIMLIPHGIPDLPFVDSNKYKSKLGIAGRTVILTFGLLSKSKGIEVMLRALPKIVKKHPKIVYIILGKTHPEVLRREGQSYKLKLEKIVKDLGLQRNVIFYDRFVEDELLHEFLGAADIYVTPYLNKEQLTSGTLAFAVGAGKAVVSTAYWAAEELLAQGRGRLVRFNDPEGIAKSIVEILGNNSLFTRMKKRAYEYGRLRTWPKIGHAYWNLFKSQETTIPIPARSTIGSQDETTPARRQMIYQTA